DHALDKVMHFIQSRPGQCHQPILAAFEGRRSEEIRHQGFAEDEASGSNHCNFSHKTVGREGCALPPCFSLAPRTPRVKVKSEGRRSKAERRPKSEILWGRKCW